MAHALWKGSINFSLVNVPVRMYTAVSPKSVRFHMIRKSDGSRIKYKKVSVVDAKEVPDDQIVKGFEVSTDHYVSITPEELDSLLPERTHTIDILSFVPANQLDCLYCENIYYLGPDKNAGKAYSLLHTVLKDTGRIAMARMIFHDKEHVVAIRSREGALLLSTVYYADEVVSANEIEDLPSEKEKPNKKELEVAKSLIEALSTTFKLSDHKDEYREKVEELIKQKAAGKKITTSPTPEKKSQNVLDLMDALKASLASAKRPAKGAKSAPAPAPRKRDKKTA